MSDGDRREDKDELTRQEVGYGEGEVGSLELELQVRQKEGYLHWAAERPYDPIEPWRLGYDCMRKPGRGMWGRLHKVDIQYTVG